MKIIKIFAKIIIVLALILAIKQISHDYAYGLIEPFSHHSRYYGDTFSQEIYYYDNAAEFRLGVAVYWTALLTIGMILFPIVSSIFSLKTKRTKKEREEIRLQYFDIYFVLQLVYFLVLYFFWSVSDGDYYDWTIWILICLGALQVGGLWSLIFYPIFLGLLRVSAPSVWFRLLYRFLPKKWAPFGP